MDKRIKGFLDALQDGAREAGSAIEINISEVEPCEWMNPMFDDPMQMARQLTPGLAFDNLEGPEGTPFISKFGVDLWWNFFHPVLGIERPAAFVRQLQDAHQGKAPRLLVEFNDPYTEPLYARLYERFQAQKPAGPIEQLQFLHAAAAQDVGQDYADELLALWLALDEAANLGEQALTLVGPVFLTCGVMQRWITRPFVPFPEELNPHEKDYYRNFIFQARTEQHADDLIDCSASRMLAGWSPKLFFSRVMDNIEAKINKARRHLDHLTHNLSGTHLSRYQLLDLRLQVLLCLINNARNAVSYQAQLDRVKSLAIEPEYNPVLGTQSSWDRQLMLQTARKEIDNTALLIQLLQFTSDPLLQLAASKQEEEIKVLAPDIADQLKKKVNIMNAHWPDYNRLFTPPNP